MATELDMNLLVDKMSVNTCMILLLFFLVANAVVAAATETTKTSDLETIRTRIKDVTSRIESARDEAEKLQIELRDNEITTAKTARQLHDIESNISNKNNELKARLLEQAKHTELLNMEKKKLAYQIRTAYQMGRNDYIKLILNQEDPALFGRTLAYYDYHNQVRSERINRIKQTLTNLEQLQVAIRNEAAQLATLKLQHEEKLHTLHQFRATRRDISTRLQTFIAEQGIELQTLQENERELETLLQGLKKKAATIEMYEELPPFDSLKGRLTWPVKGNVLKRYGDNKKSGNLKWQGVLIDAETGVGVSAVSTGKVVFADWFRNLGQLIIIDHGDGYMSLYGHNQALLKNTGDWVLTDEKIATVGDSGGQSVSALYFEIRKGVEPLNPSLWCKQ